MARLAVAALLAAALTASAASAVTSPKWTMKGAITKLSKRAISVDGNSCRITADSPRPSLHVFIVGSTVKVVCNDGVLLTIDLLHPIAPGASGQSVTSSSNAVSSSSSSSTSTTSSTSSSSSTSTSSSSSASALAIAGDFSITSLGNGSISVKSASGKFSFTCTIGTASPDVSGFHVGSHVSKLTCKDDVLTSIAP